MAFLDFIKNRKAAQQQTVAPKPQERAPGNAREYFAREDARERAALKPIESLPAGEKAKLDDIKARFEKNTQHFSTNARSENMPDVAGTQEAMRQKMTRQETIAPEMSPTSAERGVRDGEVNRPAAEEKPRVAPMKTPQPPRAKTLPRPRPSWER